MPNIESAKKRMRQNVIQRQRNKSRLSRMRTEVKRFRKLVEANQLDEARAALSSVYSVIDKTSQKGTIHANTAARYKSRLAQLLERAAVASS